MESLGVVWLSIIFLLATQFKPGSACDAPTTSSCGQPIVAPGTSRVVGGHEAVIGSWPWTVLLIEEGFATCAGAIINDHMILTAAHCFEDPISRNASRWTVMAGKHHLLKGDQGQMVFSVENIIIHENYVHDTVENDIALMTVREAIPYTTLIRPVCLPAGTSDTSLTVGKACLLAGWGDTRGTGSHEVLNEIMVPVINDSLCSMPTWYFTHFIPQKTFCAGYESGGTDACLGDSGGPLVSRFGDRWYVSGIASWGFGCAEPRWPGIYTNVTYYLPWITSKMTDYGFQTPCRILVG